ncbi:MAG TPA: hypothetical protein VEK08_16150 [Planctomycetota bacterium]|nr:hypothetical protein [Planctomycetota bacterium]
MNYDIERQYHIERIADFVRALEESSGEIHFTDDNRVLFRVGGRPFEALAWISEEYDLITITTRTAEVQPARFEDAVKMMQSTLQICWDHCVAVSPVENRYDISMALFVGGFTFEAFDGAVFNLISCAQTIEGIIKPKKKKS